LGGGTEEGGGFLMGQVCSGLVEGLAGVLMKKTFFTSGESVEEVVVGSLVLSATLSSPG
jgi:hypothetical protein